MECCPRNAAWSKGERFDVFGSRPDGLRAIRKRFALVFLSLIALAGCSGKSGASKSLDLEMAAGGASALVSCTADPRVTPYREGVSARGTHVTVALETAAPEPPGLGENVWQVRLTDENDDPFADATIAVSARMPDHRHSSPKRPQATPTDEEGRSTLSDLDLFMAGVWSVQLEITPPGETTPVETVEFTFCVEG
jgi:hypothetical protein